MSDWIVFAAGMWLGFMLCVPLAKHFAVVRIIKAESEWYKQVVTEQMEWMRNQLLPEKEAGK